MKKKFTIVILLFIGVTFIASLAYLFTKNKKPLITYKTEIPEFRTIVEEAIATGKIVPKEEVVIKPNISGVIQNVYVQAGDIVKPGDLIVKIRVIPDVSTLSSAKDRVRQSKINLDNQKNIFQRQTELFENGVISANDYDGVQTEYNQAQRAYKAALENYDIIKTGTSSGFGNVANTLVRSTINGMLLDVPIKLGNQVIGANNFNEGTTIASLADVNNMIFEGKIDESEVGKIEEGLTIKITVGAIQNESFSATLNYIAPKGVDNNGAVQFEIKGKIEKKDSIFIRSGLSANASIIIGKAENVISVSESVIQFDEDKNPFLEIETGEQQFEKRPIKTGITDGIYIEITEGISEEDKVKIWNIIKEKENNEF